MSSRVDSVSSCVDSVSSCVDSVSSRVDSVSSRVDRVLCLGTGLCPGVPVLGLNGPSRCLGVQGLGLL